MGIDRRPAATKPLSRLHMTRLRSDKVQRLQSMIKTSPFNNVPDPMRACGPSSQLEDVRQQRIALMYLIASVVFLGGSRKPDVW
jgi:hypothetical protein